MAIEISTLANLGEFDIELGVANPRTSGVSAGEGAIGYATDGSRWVKVGAGDTDWKRIILDDFIQDPVLNATERLALNTSAGTYVEQTDVPNVIFFQTGADASLAASWVALPKDPTDTGLAAITAADPAALRDAAGASGGIFPNTTIAPSDSGNSLYVDAVSGDDASATRGKNKPFKTLTAAKNAALSGDTIFVSPGNYDEHTLAKSGVNWHFYNGAIVHSTVPGVIFLVGNGDSGFSITGAGEFISDNALFFGSNSLDDASEEVFRIEAKRIKSKLGAIQVKGVTYIDVGNIETTDTLSGSSIRTFGSSLTYIKAKELNSIGYDCIWHSGGTIYADVEKFVANQSCIESDGDGELFIRAGSMRSTGSLSELNNSTVIMKGAGTVNIFAQEIISADAAAIYVTNGECQVTAQSIKGGADEPAILVSGDDSFLRLDNSNVFSNTTHEVLEITSGSPKIILANNTFVAGSSATNSITGTGSINIYGSLLTNKTPAGTITELVGVTTVDSHVE